MGDHSAAAYSWFMERRIFGIENEYGVTCTTQGQRRLTPDEVARYLFRRVVAWGRSSNVFLGNGARLYLDVGSHPEYATAECDSVRELVIQDKAGERILEGLVEDAQGRLRDDGVEGEIFVFKNNTDSAGNSYGCHENYCYGRSGDFQRVSDMFIPFLISRQITCGAGKVVATAHGASFAVSQRADHIWEGVSSATTRSRPIINTRDEPHADADKYRRLHVIIGDANMSEYSTLLKVGTAALVLDMIEAGVRFDELRLSEPVRSVHRISHDPSLKLLVDTVDGRKLTALDVQRSYFEKACKHVENTLGADVDEATAEVLSIWGEVLDDLAREPLSTADRLDWTAKLRLLEGYRERDGLAWDAPRLHLVDLQYTDVRMAKGLYNRLATRGSIKRLVTEEQVTAAMTAPPEDTRAYFRGRCLERYPAEVAAASWDSVIFDLGRESLVRIPTLEPLRGTRRHVGELIDNSRTAEELVEALTRG